MSHGPAHSQVAEAGLHGLATGLTPPHAGVQLCRAQARLTLPSPQGLHVTIRKRSPVYSLPGAKLGPGTQGLTKDTGRGVPGAAPRELETYRMVLNVIQHLGVQGFLRGPGGCRGPGSEEQQQSGKASWRS